MNLRSWFHWFRAQPKEDVPGWRIERKLKGTEAIKRHFATLSPGLA